MSQRTVAYLRCAHSIEIHGRQKSSDHLRVTLLESEEKLRILGGERLLTTATIPWLSDLKQIRAYDIGGAFAHEANRFSPRDLAVSEVDPILWTTDKVV
jgi:hypothetical protein